MVQSPSKFFEYVDRPPFRAFEQLSLDYEGDARFHLSGGGVNPGRIKRLMPLPDSAYLKIDGEIISAAHGNYLIDDTGAVYDYLYELDAAIESENTKAYSAAGLPPVFAVSRARIVKVIPLERALELLSA